jgi:hypothetical protein
MSHINKVQPILVKNYMHSSNTCDMYMCRLRHINDPVLSPLKMEGIRLLCLTFSTFFLLNAAAAVESETPVVRDARTG